MAAAHQQAEPPYLLLFPYLPIQAPIDLGRWQLVSLDDFDGPWESAGFERRSREVAHRHVDRGGSPVARPSILVEGDTGATGRVPDSDDYDALKLTLGFAVIDGAPAWRSPAEIRSIARWQARTHGEDPDAVEERLTDEQLDGGLAVQFVGTADNAEPYFWPINAAGDITRDYGTIVRTRMAGSGRGLHGKVIAPNELHLPTTIRIDAERTAALYDLLLAAPHDESALRTRESIRWMLQAWRNTPSIIEAQRVVMLRTAFEVLLYAGRYENSKEKLARRLSERFERLPLDQRREVHPGTLLWQPKQRRRSTIPGANRTLAPYNALERWFIGFSETRNQILHQGRTTELEDTSYSVFAGPYWRVATRVLQETVIVGLSQSDHPGLWGDPFHRILVKLLTEGLESESQ